MVRLVGLRKSFRMPDGNEHIVVDDISLDVPRGSFTSIVGTSGCGKSTLLSMISGLTDTTAGDITIDGRRVLGIQRGIGFLFQHDALLPWRTVWDNVALGLILQRYPREEITRRVTEWIARVGLRGFERHYPAQLSGGMRKRAGLAQMMVYSPDLILMDEPFAALDAQTRVLMEADLLRIVEQSGEKTVLFVTHDLEEAVSLSDRVVLMTAGPAARIKAAYDVDLPRPRDVLTVRQEPHFGELYTLIWQGLREEAGRTFDQPIDYTI